MCEKHLETKKLSAWGMNPTLTGGRRKIYWVVFLVVTRQYGALTDRPSKVHWDLTNGMALVKSHCNSACFAPIGFAGTPKEPIGWSFWR